MSRAQTERGLLVTQSPSFVSGEGGIRTRGGGLSPHAALAKRCYRPLSHLSK
jgi:hypothetical protein